MDKVSLCLERIRLVRGVNYGIITKEQIEDLIVLYDLTEQEQENLFDALLKENIVPISYDEAPEKVKNIWVPSVKNEPKELSEEELAEFRKRRFEISLSHFNQTVNCHPELTKKYEEQLLAFIDVLLEANEEPNITVEEKVAEAAYSAYYRNSCDPSRNRCRCGTYANRIFERYLRWQRAVFSESELSQLLNCVLEKQELSDKHKEMVMLMLYNAHTPNFGCVRRRKLSSFVDEDTTE